MPAWIAIAAPIALVLAAVLLYGYWQRKRASEQRWKESMQRLTAFCENFAAKNGLTCVSGVAEWPFGWPRIHGRMDEGAFSLAFGWEQADVWSASMRLRATGRIRGEFTASRNEPTVVNARARRIRFGDAEFDTMYCVQITDATDVTAILTARARHALLAIPGAELSYRDGVVVLTWPCDEFVADGALTDDDFATIDFGYDVLAEIAQTSRPQQATR